MAVQEDPELSSSSRHIESTATPQADGISQTPTTCPRKHGFKPHLSYPNLWDLNQREEPAKHPALKPRVTSRRPKGLLENEALKEVMHRLTHPGPWCKSIRLKHIQTIREGDSLANLKASAEGAVSIGTLSEDRGASSHHQCNLLQPQQHWPWQAPFFALPLYLTSTSGWTHILSYDPVALNPVGRLALAQCSPTTLPC